MENLKKFVVLKGAEGFADRLECLLQAIRYAKVTQRTLVVDWRDLDWSHDRQLSFDNYFRIEGIKWTTLSDFKQKFKANGKNVSIFPPRWIKDLHDDAFDRYMRQNEYRLPDNSACIEAISSGIMCDFEETIVIYPGVGHRTFHYIDASHIIPSDDIKVEIMSFAEKYNLVENGYDVIHLRGGTKTWAGGEISDDHPDKDLHQQWKTKEDYLRNIYEVHQINTKDLPTVPLFALTDTPCLADTWNVHFPEAKLLPNSAHGMLHDTGIHKLRKDHLISTGVGKCLPSKHTINFEAIRDFIIMTNSRSLVGDGVSLYSKLAFHLKLSNTKLLRLQKANVYSYEHEELAPIIETKLWHF